jgi:hypothetical protein
MVSFPGFAAAGTRPRPPHPLTQAPNPSRQLAYRGSHPEL